MCADRSVISMKLLFHKITGPFSSEEWREAFLVSLYCFSLLHFNFPPLLLFPRLCNKVFEDKLVAWIFWNWFGAWMVGATLDSLIKYLSFVHPFPLHCNFTKWLIPVSLSRYYKPGCLIWSHMCSFFSRTYSDIRLSKGCTVQAFLLFKSFIHGLNMCVCAKQYIWTNSSFVFHSLPNTGFHGKDDLE